MLRRLTALLLGPALAFAFAQDERRAVSPDGRVEFRVFVAQQTPGYLIRLAYEVNVDGKPVIAPSYLGLDLLNQEPLLGENDGLIGSHTGSGAGFNSLVVDYMQNGSIGRLVNVEARVYNDGVAFRYVLPRSTPLVELMMSDEATEFRFAQGKEALRGVGETGRLPLPFVTALPGRGVLGISEVRQPNFPAMSLTRLDANTLVTRLATNPKNAEVAYEGNTPWTGPWRVILFGTDRERLLNTAWLKNLRP